MARKKENRFDYLSIYLSVCHKGKPRIKIKAFVSPACCVTASYSLLLDNTLGFRLSVSQVVLPASDSTFHFLFYFLSFSLYLFKALSIGS